MVCSDLRQDFFDGSSPDTVYYQLVGKCHHQTDWNGNFRYLEGVPMRESRREAARPDLQMGSVAIVK
jgi:hypothetical protein